MRRLGIACLSLLIAGAYGAGMGGCASRAEPDPLKTAGGHSSMSLNNGGSIPPAPKVDADDARRAIPVVIALDVFHLVAPFGAISRNDDFWKRVDEDRVDVGTHDLLLKNGIRIGIGREADWPYFKGLLGRYPSAKSARLRTPPGREGYLELAMRTNIPEQSILGIDDHNVDWGRSFEKCDDLLGISFIASRHNPGESIVKVCPIVRGLRRYFHVSVLNNEETQVELDQPSQLYDMRLEALVPLNDFLIVAPSKQAELATSLGATFLTSDGKAEPLEHVLVIVPRPYRTDDPTPADAAQ